MRFFRTTLFWCHLAAGVTASVVVLIMSVTGVLLTYERQILHWADTRAFVIVPPAPDSPRLPVDALLERARPARPGPAPQAIAIRSDRTSPVAVAWGREGMVYLHPYTAAVLGSGSPGVRAFFRSVTDWHRWLAMSGTQRGTGRAITGAANLLFLFIVCSGMYLWFPRIRTWVQFKQVLWFRRGLGDKARDFNWHNVIGVWSAVPLAIVVASGVVISYPWASNLVYRVMGEAPPAPARAAAGPQAAAGGGQTNASRAASPRAPEQARERSLAAAEGASDELQALVARAERQVDGWRIITMRVPATADAPVAFTIDRGDGGQPQKRDQLTLDPRSGQVVRWEPFSSATPGRRLRMILRFAHTGEVLGLAGQTIAGLVSAGGAVLVYTGLALSCRRFLAWRRRHAASAAVVRPPQGVAPAEAIPTAARQAEAVE
jgi:uncharacterized iron-regulated membrane protein